MQLFINFGLASSGTAELKIFTCIVLLIDSRSLKISDRVLLPIMFRNVVWAKSRVEACASLTFVTDIVALYIRKYTTASTVTVTLSFVSTWSEIKYDLNLQAKRSRTIKLEKLSISRITSCGGTSNETVRRSILEYASMHGNRKKVPNEK